MAPPETLFQVVATVMGLLVGVSIWMQASVARNARCRYCDHCRKALQDEQLAKAKRRHENYHMLTDRAPSACNDPECPGRK